jgi:hypothetical protein
MWNVAKPHTVSTPPIAVPLAKQAPSTGDAPGCEGATKYRPKWLYSNPSSAAHEAYTVLPGAWIEHVVGAPLDAASQKYANVPPFAGHIFKASPIVGIWNPDVETHTPDCMAGVTVAGENAVQLPYARVICGLLLEM